MMKRLLAYLFIVLGLGLTFNIHASYAQIVESDDNLDKLRRVIINDPKFFEKSKYFSKIFKGINPKTGDKIETSVVAVYLNYDEILETITKNPEINSIGNFAWGFEFSKKNLNGLTAKFTGRKAIDACYKDAKKKKLSDGECIFVDFQNNLGDWANSHRGQNYLYKERQKRKILASGKIDESDEMLNKLYKVIMNDPDFIKKNKYLKYSKVGKYNKVDIKTMALAVYLNYEKEILDLMLHPLLLELEPYAWGWEYSSVDSDYYDGFTAIQRCYKDATKKKLSGGECIIVDFRKPTGDAQYPALAKNYLLEERETRKVIAQNSKKSKKLIESNKKKDALTKVYKKEYEEITSKVRYTDPKLLAAYLESNEIILNDYRGNGKVNYQFEKKKFQRINDLGEILSSGEYKISSKGKILLREKKNKFEWKLSILDGVIDIKSNYYPFEGYKRFGFDFIYKNIAKEERQKQQKLLAKKKEAEEKKKEQELLAKQKAAEEKKKEQELLAKQKADEEKKEQELLAKQEEAEEKFKEKQKDQNIDKSAPEILVAEKITTNSQVYTLKGKVKDQSKFILEIDGQPLKLDEKGNFIFEGFIIDEDEGEELTLIATDRWNNISEKIVKVNVEIKKTKVAKSYEKLMPNKINVKKDENRIALVIGIEKYENLTNLDAVYANRDAKAFKAYANRALGIPTENIKVLIDQEASRSDTLKALKLWLPQKTKGSKKDIFIFFAGHGLASDDGEDLYVLPQDGDSILLKDTAISRAEMFEQIQKLNPNSVTMFFDTCYSGQTRKEETLIAGLRPIRIVAEKSKTPSNFTIFSASNLTQTSGSIEEAKHGIFSYYLMKGLEGKADLDQNKKITNGELIAYLKQNVSEEAFTNNRQQEPMLSGNPEKVLISFR